MGRPGTPATSSATSSPFPATRTTFSRQTAPRHQSECMSDLWDASAQGAALLRECEKGKLRFPGSRSQCCSRSQSQSQGHFPTSTLREQQADAPSVWDSSQSPSQSGAENPSLPGMGQPLRRTQARRPVLEKQPPSGRPQTLSWCVVRKSPQAPTHTPGEQRHRPDTADKASLQAQVDFQCTLEGTGRGRLP